MATRTTPGQLPLLSSSSSSSTTSSSFSSSSSPFSSLLSSFLLALLLPPILFLAPSVLGSEKGMDFSYHNNSALHSVLLDLSVRFPNITRLYSIGKSVEGRDLWVIAIGENPHDHVTLRPNVKYVANMHGNEVVGRELLLHLGDHLIRGYGHNSSITALLQSCTVHLLPSLNPDGFHAANTTDCTGVQGRKNANGFDLNRNFPDFFQENMAVVQKETQAVVRWVRDTRFVLSANLHGGAMVANYPFDSYSGTMRYAKPSLSPDNDVFEHLARVYSYSHHTMHHATQCDPHDPIFNEGITNGANWYPLKGGMQDYNYVRASCYELTLELSCCKYPPPSSLAAFWEDNRDALFNYLSQVHMGVKGLVRGVNDTVLQDAVVVVEGREQVPFRTSPHGEYWKLLLPGSYVLVVSRSGYGPKSLPFTVVDGSVTRLDVTLTQDGSSPAPPFHLPPPLLPCALLAALVLLGGV